MYCTIMQCATDNVFVVPLLTLQSKLLGESMQILHLQQKPCDVPADGTGQPATCLHVCRNEDT